MIQIRNVPDELHRTLKVRAAKAGMTLSDYLLSEIEQIAGKSTMKEWHERVAELEPVEPLLRMEAHLAQAPGIGAEVELYR